jgi:Holliday junction resolvasome RuvABC endonuclease subunit
MKILSLDIATKCGWAHSNGASGVWNLSVKRDESSGMRLLRLEAKLNEVLDSVGVHFVVYEAARHGAPHMQGALVVHAEMQGVVKRWCDSFGIQYKGYSPKEIKKHATGNANASKDMMVEAACDKWPDTNIVDDNQADALWLLDLAMSEYCRGSKK